MPRLSDTPNIHIKAVSVLIKQYAADPCFRRQLDQICQRYRSLVNNFTLDFLNSHRNAILLGDSEYQCLVDDLNEQIKMHEMTCPKFERNKYDHAQACINELSQLAYEWKLRIPAAGFFLFITKFTEVVKSLDIQIQIGPSFHPDYQKQVEPLKLEDIPGWLMIAMDQTKIIDNLRRTLAGYYHQLKDLGFSEIPSHLEQHAYWWFQHYVYKKKYKELEKDHQSPNEESIKRAVWRFSKLIGVTLTEKR